MTGLIFLLISVFAMLLNAESHSFWFWIGNLAGGLGGALVSDSGMLRGKDLLMVLGCLLANMASMIVFTGLSTNLTMSMTSVFLISGAFATLVLLLWVCFYRIIRLNWLRSATVWVLTEMEVGEGTVLPSDFKQVYSRPFCWDASQFIIVEEKA